MIANRFNPLGKMPPTPSMRYSQDGLVLQLDGIENVGRGRHDADSTEWVDLISGRKFSNRADAVTPIAFVDNYCHISGSNYSYLECPNCADIQDVFDSEVFTIEIGCKSGTVNNARILIRNRGTVWSTNRTPGILLADKQYVPNNNVGETGITASLVAIRNISTGSTYSYKNGAYMSYYQSGAFNTIVDDDTLRFGIGGYVWNSMLMYAYYFRLYNRELTKDELGTHLAIDKERFDI